MKTRYYVETYYNRHLIRKHCDWCGRYLTDELKCKNPNCPENLYPSTNRVGEG